MGVKHLWTVLAPFCDRKPLYELQGKTVAVDLSCWICEAQNIADYQVQPRMYLRNLYFRTCYLLMMNVSPVFVLEGKAPELKYDTISARNAVQFKGAKPKSDKVKTGKDRTRFHFVLRQCEEMLGYMGLACIKGNGEAESLCAYLNEDGLVDGCISQDSDCFAYGAKVVYRNFSISTQGTQTASGGSVDVYDITKANQALDFGRNKIVAMALLIGCDYSEGVHGVGKDSVLKFFDTITNDEVLRRLRFWRENADHYRDMETRLNDKNLCTSCGHKGKLQNHTRNGCQLCRTTKGCDSSRYKSERLNMRNELNMRTKAIEDPKFPDNTLIDEFLNRKDNVKQLDLTWKQPNIVKFMKFTINFLQWEELYAFEKILPILTRWQCKNYDLLNHGKALKGVLVPERIKKVRNPKGVPSYEIIWSDPNNYFGNLIPEEQINNNKVDVEKLWSTIEPQELVEKAYPDLVQSFKLSKIKPKKPAKRKKKGQVDLEDLSESLKNVSISEPKPKKTRKPRATRKGKNAQCVDDLEDLNSSLNLLSIDTKREAKSSKQNTLDNFLKRAVTNSYRQREVEYCATKTLTPNCSTPLKTQKHSLDMIDFEASCFGDEEDLNLTGAVDDIVSRKTVANELQQVADRYVIATTDGYLNTDKMENKQNYSSFFIDDPTEKVDLFEKTFNDTFKNFNSDSSNCSGSDDDTEMYDCKEIEVEANQAQIKEIHSDNVELLISSDDDSFCMKKYVPLEERLKLTGL